MSSEQSSLTAFRGVVTPQPAQDDEDLHGLGSRLVSGFTTRSEREERSHDRVVTGERCPRCGAPWDGEGVCPEHAAEGEVLDTNLRTIGGGER